MQYHTKSVQTKQAARVMRGLSIALLLTMCALYSGFAQGDAPKDTTGFRLPSFIKFSGSASIFGELYGTIGGVQGSARRPPGTARANVQMTLSLFNEITLPFSLRTVGGGD